MRDEALKLTFTAYKSGFWTLGPWGVGMASQLGRTDRSGLAVGLTNNSANGSAWTLETQVGVSDNHISYDWSTKVLGGVKVKVGGSIGTETGISAFVDSERKVTNSVKAGVTVTCALAGGVTMKIKCGRRRIRKTLLTAEQGQPPRSEGSASYLGLPKPQPIRGSWIHCSSCCVFCRFAPSVLATEA